MKDYSKYNKLQKAIDIQVSMFKKRMIYEDVDKRFITLFLQASNDTSYTKIVYSLRNEILFSCDITAYDLKVIADHNPALITFILNEYPSIEQNKYCL